MLQFVQRNNTQNTDDACIRLMQETGWDELFCRLLCLRGITDKKAAQDYLAPSFSQLHDPFLFSGMQAAKARIEKARENKEKVCIYGDYDVDGICAVTILYSFLKFCGVDVSYYVPSRKKEGYGMNVGAVERLHEMGISLIITVDNGIVAHEEVKRAYELGMQVIITDHHQCPEAPPKCEAVICHTVPGETYPNTNICGAGTALKLVQALGGDEAAREFIPFAGLATVADIVELTGENRAIVSLALSAVNSDNCPIGLNAITQIAKSGKKAAVTERDFAFTFAPRLNAAGRMGDANIGIELLCCHDSDRAREIAAQLDELNVSRRSEEQEIIEDAFGMIKQLDLTETRIIVLKSDKWNSGIVGIAASKIVEKYYRPCILLCEKDGVLTGSARSTSEIDIYDVMYAFSDMYMRFGGHSLAAGVTMKTELFEEYREKINEYVISRYPFTVFIPKCFYDLEASLSSINVKTAGLLESLAPFGEGNPKPVLMLRGAKFQKLQRIGAELNHLNGRLSCNNSCYDFVAFEKGYLFPELLNAESCDILFSPSVNEWKNDARLQLRVESFSRARIKDAKDFFAAKAELFTDAYGKNLHVYSEKPFTPQKCSEKLLRSLLKSSCDGTLILSRDPESAAYLSDFLNDTGCICDTAFFVPSSLDMCFNTLCAAPDLNKIALSRYFRIILCGAFSVYQAGALHEMLPDTQLLYLDVNANNNDVALFADVCRRQNIGRFYTNMNRIITQKPLLSDELVSSVCDRSGENRALCRFCLEVFLELGLFFSDKNGRINPNITANRVELSSSRLYRAAQGYSSRLLPE